MRLSTSRAHARLPSANTPRTLSETRITDLASLARAIHVLHSTYRVPHVIITSLRLTPDNQIPAGAQDPPTDTLTVIGSTATSAFAPRLFRIDTPALPLFFSGTGDMFAALTVPRLIEAVAAAPAAHNLASTPSWRSPDDVAPEHLPLAAAVQKVLASMQAVLARTADVCKAKMEAYDAAVERGAGAAAGADADGVAAEDRHLALMNASEVVVPRYARELRDPPCLDRFRPRAVGVRVDGEGEGEGEK